MYDDRFVTCNIVFSEEKGKVDLKKIELVSNPLTPRVKLWVTQIFVTFDSGNRTLNKILTLNNVGQRCHAEFNLSTSRSRVRRTNRLAATSPTHEIFILHNIEVPSRA